MIYREYSKEYDSWHEKYDNDVINVRLKSGINARLLEITWVTHEIEGHQLQLAIVGVWNKEKQERIPTQIQVSEIAFPTPYLITDKIREIVEQDGGDLESIEMDANYFCIYG